MTNPKGQPLRAKRPSTVTKRFRCSPAEERRWLLKAKRSKMSFSDYVRLALDSCGPIDRDEEK